MPSSRRIFLTQGPNPRLMSPASAGRFSTTTATWEAQGGEHMSLTQMRTLHNLEILFIF